MAFAHIRINPASPKGSPLVNRLRNLKRTIAELQDDVLAMDFMIDAGDYARLESEYGTDTGFGGELKNEVASLVAKLTTDASVSNVMAAINQAARKIG